jgi:DNA-binding MarR family transcriptional regulator
VVFPPATVPGISRRIAPSSGPVEPSEPSVVDDGLRAWRGVLTAHRRLVSDLDDLLGERCGLTVNEYDVLHQLSREPQGLRMAELTERVLFTKGAVTKHVSRLEVRGWVRRCPVDGDRRGVQARLTATGRRGFVRARAVQEAWSSERVTSVLGADGTRELADLLWALAADEG